MHFIRNALAHAGKSGRRVASTFIATACAQDDAEAARAQWRRVADQLRPKLPKLATFLDEWPMPPNVVTTRPQLHHARGVRHAKLMIACGCKSHPAKAVAGKPGPSLAGVAATRGLKCRQEPCGVRE